MVLALIQDKNTSQALEESASQLANSLGKEYSVASLDSTIKQLSAYCEEKEVSFLFIQLIENKARKIQQLLNSCRELRIPYIIFKNSFENLRTNKIILPVNFLEEEVEKAQFASAFGRFCNSEIHILQANDYGSKAATNVERMQELFNKFDLNVQVEKAKGDSFKVDKEAVNKAIELKAGLIIITASRDYGLDDILFGPREQHLIRKSTIPLLIVNPRADLYALCD
jgi:nucleotide-binding universal stress UspA family protein